MNITKEWLYEKSACSEGVEWFLSQKETEDIKVIKSLISEDKLEWANWTICRVFDYKQRVQYAVFAAEQVIDIFEKKHPADKRPRLAIEAAKKCIDDPSKENRKAAAYVAAYAARAAADAAYAANAAYAARAAACAADAAYAANAAYAASAADAAAYVAANAKDKIKKKILEYGLDLLKEE
jgi:hypothetical protein